MKSGWILRKFRMSGPQHSQRYHRAGGPADGTQVASHRPIKSSAAGIVNGTSSSRYRRENLARHFTQTFPCVSRVYQGYQDCLRPFSSRRRCSEVSRAKVTGAVGDYYTRTASTTGWLSLLRIRIQESLLPAKSNRRKDIEKRVCQTTKFFRSQTH